MAGQVACFGLLGLLSLASQPALAQKVVKMPMNQKRNSTGLLKRDPFLISMQNFIPYGEYFVTASIGTPAQEIELIVDTGSSDIWMFGSGSCTQGPCEGGSFNPASSNTLVRPAGGRGAFQIQYQTKGSGVTGDYIMDTFAVGGVSVSSLMMAVATQAAQVPSGIMGIGLAVNEAIVSQGGQQYQNFPDVLVAQNKISSKAYSLYLDDLSTATGTILFGGYDEAKFQGDLKMLPLQRDDQSNDYTSFTVAWTSLGVQGPNGDFALETSNFLYGAVLDTGTTLTYLPTPLYESMFTFFNATYLQQDDITIVPCDFGKKNPGQVVFGLGGVNGVQIQVDFDEYAVPLYDQNTGDQITTRAGVPLCQFGMGDAGEGYSILFGQTFLRSAYVLYDLDNLQAGVAQTIFDSETSNIVEYDGRQSTNRIESVTAGPTVAVVQSATAVPGASYYNSQYLSGYISSGFYGSGGGNAPSATEAPASTVATDYTLSTVSYPANALPTAYPTAIPEGATGRVTAAGNDDGSPFNGGATASAGSGGSTNGGNGMIAPVLASMGAVAIAVLTAVAML